MKKRHIISLILTVILLALTNQWWLFKKTVDVSFDIEGNQKVKITAALGSRSEDMTVDLNEKNHLTFQIHKRGTFKQFSIAIYPESSDTLSKLVVSNVTLMSGKIKLDNLSKFNIAGSKSSIQSNELTLIPTKNMVILSYDIIGNPPTIFNLGVFLSIFILGFLLSCKLSNYLIEFKVHKNYSILDIIFVTIFFVFLFIPMCHINLDDISKSENRTLAKMPSFIEKDGQLNYLYGKQFEEYFNDRFTLRTNFLQLNILIQMLNFDKIELSDYIYRKDNQTIIEKDLLPQKLYLSKNQVESIVENFKALNDFCKTNKIKLYILITPVTNNVYIENCYKFITSNAIRRYNNQIYSMKNKSDVKIIYPYNELFSAKSNINTPIYYKTDNHWTEDGAYIGYLALANEIKKDYPNLPIFNKNNLKAYRSKEVLESGPHPQMFSYGNIMTPFLFCKKIINLELNSEYLYYKSDPDLKIYEISKPYYLGTDYYYTPGLNKKLLIMGTSMNETLMKFLPYSFQNTKFIRLNGPSALDGTERYKVMKHYKKEILDYKPDVLIYSVSVSNLKGDIKHIFEEAK